MNALTPESKHQPESWRFLSIITESGLQSPQLNTSECRHIEQGMAP